MKTRINEFPQQADGFNKNQYLELVKSANLHAAAYYTQDAPQIDDAEYDSMVRLLTAIEALHPQWVAPDSVTHRVGGEIRKEFPEAIHQPPMMSLDNAANIEEFQDFCGRIKRLIPKQKGETLFVDEERDPVFCAELKLDGLAVELIYQEGLLISGSTRGDGARGEDITHNIRTIQNIPLRLQLQSPPQYISIRGECVLPMSDFQALNEGLEKEGKKVFANPRNAAAGSLRQQDSSVAASRGLKFFPYAIGRVEESPESQKRNPAPTLQSQRVENYFPALGFQTIKERAAGPAQEVEKFYRRMEELRASLDVDIDGVVVKLDDSTLWPTLGYTAKSPRYAIAIKFPGRRAITQLLDVSFQVGRSGAVTPVAHLAPVNVGGVVVRRATLHNIKEIQRLALKIGDLVEVIRAGDVIPKVERRLEKSEQIEEGRERETREIQFPVVCPDCKTLLEVQEILVRCPNRQCPGRMAAFLRYFVSKGGLDIDGLGSEWVEKLFVAGIIEDIADIFLLAQPHNVERIQGMDGMGEKLLQNILSSIDKRRSTPFDVFLRSLGIAQVGSGAARILAASFSSLEELAAAKVEELQEIHEIGPIMAASLVEFFNDAENKTLLTKLLESGFTIEYPEKGGGAHPDFEGKSFVFTGTLTRFSREAAQQVVRNLGGKAASSVSKKTHFLVYGDAAGSKLKKAEELGVALLTEEEFEAMAKRAGGL